MTVLSWMLLSVYVSLAQAEQGVIVQGPLQIEAVPVLSLASSDRLASAEAVWVWSPFEEPRRLTPEELKKRDRPRFGAGRTLQVRCPGVGEMTAGSLRLIAAPIEMWNEVPESLLPAWPLPRSGRLTIPADAARNWRLRIAGEGAGSFWTDLPAGAAQAVLSVVPASGSHFVVVGEGERTVAGSSVRILEKNLGRLGGGKAWAYLIGDERGRFALPGLPDRSELAWLASAREHPPKRVVNTPSRLEKIVLADGAAVTGRLVDPGGRPLAGVSAQVDAWASSEAPIPLIVHTKTDAKGRFVAKAVPPGKAMLVAVNSGWAPFQRAIEVPREGLDVGDVALSRGDSLAVRVVNDMEEPVAGADIRPDLGEAATTGPDGSAILNHLPVRTMVRIAATAKGHLRADKTVEVPANGPLELQLQRTFAVRGRFVGEDGAPFADAAVKMTRGRSFDSASLDADGSFSLSLRPAQEYTLTFTSPQSASLEVSVPEGSPGEERDLGELRAPAAASIVGRLVDGATGDPVSGGRIWCPRPSPQGPVLAWMNRDLLDTTSGPDGTFRLRGVPFGLVSLRIEASGFARTHRGADVSREGSADLGDVPLSRGTTLVVAAGPKGEGAVVAVDPGSEGLPFDRLTAPVFEGIGRVEQVPAGAARVEVMRGSSILCETLVQVPAAGELPVECSAEGMAVHGVVTMGGRPAGAGVLVWETAAGPYPDGIMTFKTASGLTQQQVFTANTPQVDVTVEPGGLFATRELRAGKWQVTFQPDGGGSTQALEVALSEAKEQTLALPYPGFSVSGTVVDAEGKAVEEARVRETEGGATVLSAKDGFFRFDGLRAKTYFFSATKEGTASEPVELAVGEGGPKEPLVLVLRPETRRPALEVSVADERGAPAPGAFVFVELPGRSLRVLTADSSGVAKLLLDPPYPATVRAAARIGGGWALGAWQPVDRDRNGLTLSPGPTGTLGVSAGKSEGLLQISAPGGWNLTFLLSTLGAPPFLKRGVALEIGGLPVGTYQLNAGERAASVTVREGERVEVGWGER
ncbi:MAG TPA: carboxypeptidase-like regulatory domain-containing protein [Thermoanaerobaculia bacterium]|nr:carboxypeptidase-like regulatory domain-containing protein [Thermoanaerobaculia bacterium]